MREATATHDQWGRSIAAMEAELEAARAALAEAVERTSKAYDQIWASTTLAQERKAQLAWDKAHEAQNRAASRWHDANRALGRSATADWS